MPDDRPSVTVYVDASIFTETESVGHITGNITLPFVPQIGDIILFSHPEGGIDATLVGQPLVEKIIFKANSSQPPSIMLSDIYVRTKSDGFKLFRYLETCFGLFANIHGDEDLQTYLGTSPSGEVANPDGKLSSSAPDPNQHRLRD